MISGDMVALAPGNTAYETYTDSYRRDNTLQKEAFFGEVETSANDDEILLSIANGGYARLVPTTDPAVLELDTVFVGEEARGQGVGSLLVSRALDTAKELGYSKLTTEAANERVVQSLRSAGDTALRFSLKNESKGTEKPLRISPAQVITVFQEHREKNPEERDDDMLNKLSVTVTVQL